MTHTKEPWPSIGAFTAGSARLGREDYERARVCVNACEGIPTADLKMDKPTFVAMMMQRQTLQLQKRELIDALKLVTDELEQLHNHYYRDCEGRNCPAGKYVELARSVMAIVGAGETAPDERQAYPIPEFLRKQRD